MIKNPLAFIAALLLIPSLILNLIFYKQLREQRTEKGESVVLEVIDGDTFIIDSLQRIRLGNLESPEPEFCGGKEAKKRLEDLILNKKVRLDIFAHDQFNRPLAIVYQNKTLINEVILKEGLARYDGSPSPKREVLKKAYDFAFQNKLGIFSSLCFAEKPDNPSCLIKGNINRHTKEKTYHFPGCSGYPQVLVEKDLGEDWFCSEEEAMKAGYTKSKNCFNKNYSP